MAAWRARDRSTDSAPVVAPRDVTRIYTDELLQRAGRGDESAFAALYDALADAVFGTARRVLRDPGMAEEVAQQVMVEVWRTAPRFDPAAGSAVTYVLTIAHRRAVDRVRRETAEARRVDRWASSADVGPAEVDDAVIDGLERRRVAAALGSLTPRQREAIDLAFTGGYTHTEIASILALPLGTVKTRIRDGLIRLRDELGEGA